MSDHTIAIIWVIKIFLYSSSVYSCHLFLISSASVRSIPFMSYMMPIFAWNILLVALIFLRRSLNLPLYSFPLFLCIVHLRRLSYISLLFFGLCFQMGISFFFSFAFHFSSFLSYLEGLLRQSFCLLHFFILGMVLITVSCTMELCLSDLIPWISLLLPLYNHKGLDLGLDLDGLVVFPTFFNLSPNLAIRSSWSEP